MVGAVGHVVDSLGWSEAKAQEQDTGSPKHLFNKFHHPRNFLG